MNKYQHPNLSPDLTEKERTMKLTMRFGGPGTRKKNPKLYDARGKAYKRQGNAA